MNADQQNAAESNTEDTSHLCPPCPDIKGKRPKTGRPLSRMECLSERQLEHVNAWLDEGVSLKEIVTLCKTEFQVEIPKTTFQRYYKRSAARTLIADLADSKEAAAEISKYAVTGVALFSTTTLEILEQQAFDLAVAFNRDADADDLGTLKNLWTLIHKAKNTNIRERHATVQEQKIQLRREELALKRELLASKNCGGTSSASPTSLSGDAINDHAAAPAAPCASASLSQQGRGLGEGFTTRSTTGAQTPSAPSASKSENQNNNTIPPRPLSPIERLLAGEWESTVIPPEIPCPDPDPLIKSIYPEEYRQYQERLARSSSARDPRVGNEENPS